MRLDVALIIGLVFGTSSNAMTLCTGVSTADPAVAWVHTTDMSAARRRDR
jgi:hypothetical protein